MPSLSQIRTGIRETVATIPGITGYANVPEVANLPAFVVVPRQTDFNVAFGRGQDAYEFDVIVLTSRRDDNLAQLELDDYVNGFGEMSVREAIWNNRTLGLTGTDATVVGMSDYGARWDIGELDHVGARLTVRVMTTGTA